MLLSHLQCGCVFFLCNVLVFLDLKKCVAVEWVEWLHTSLDTLIWVLNGSFDPKSCQPLLPPMLPVILSHSHTYFSEYTHLNSTRGIISLFTKPFGGVTWRLISCAHSLVLLLYSEPLLKVRGGLYLAPVLELFVLCRNLISFQTLGSIFGEKFANILLMISSCNVIFIICL